MEMHDMVRIVNFIVKMGFGLGFALGLHLNDKEQIVLVALGLHLDFVIFTPTSLWGYVCKI